MNVSAAPIPDIKIIQPQRFGDARGYFMETYHAQRYRQAGIDAVFVQDNLSRSRKGVLRGLHYQHPNGQGKLVQVLEGAVLDVAVDIRRGSPTFGKWVAVELSADNGLQMYIPVGFAHGFVVLSDWALFSYKCTAFYDPSTEGGVLWNDPQLGIDWRIAEPILSEKDKKNLPLASIPPERLPRYGA